MALSSGPAASGLLPGTASFAGNSGYRYSIAHQNNKLFLDFAKARQTDRRELAWFVGSGTAARSYLLQVDNFLYEAPPPGTTARTAGPFRPATTATPLRF